jgi:hypothetical protein
MEKLIPNMEKSKSNYKEYTANQPNAKSQGEKVIAGQPFIRCVVFLVSTEKRQKSIPEFALCRRERQACGHK